MSTANGLQFSTSDENTNTAETDDIGYLPTKKLSIRNGILQTFV